MATTNFKVFNEANTTARTYTDEEYKSEKQRLQGVTPGMANSRLHNKMFYQWSSMTKAIADTLVAAGYDCNDNDVNGIVEGLQDMLAKAGTDTVAPIIDGTTPVAKADTLTNPRTISLTGAVTGSASFDGSGDVSIDSTSEVQKISITGDVTGSADFSGSNVSISVSDVLGLINVIQTVGLSHNGIYRGKNLGTISSVSELETFLTAHKVSDGLFTDLYVGDYFTLKDGTYNKEWEIAGFDLYLGKGMDVDKHHLTLIPKRNLLKSVMNSTNTSTGGYYNSYMNQTTIPAVVTNMKKVLGDHMLTKQCLLTDTVDANIASNAGAGLKGAATGTWTWRNVQAVLPSEVEALGYTCASSSWFDVMDACMPLPLFRFKNHREPDGQDWWLRAVATSYGFATVTNTGSLAANNVASASRGVRPLIWVG